MGKHKDTISMENNTRRIRLEPEQNPQYIVFTRKVGGVAETVDEYMTYHPELLKILMLDCMKSWRDNNGYLRFKVYEGGSETDFSIYDLAFCCYSDRVHAESFLSDIQQFKEEKGFYKLSIDHADNVIYNHTVYNLSLVPITKNSQKGEIVAKFRMPSKISVAYVDGKYRVHFENLMQDTARLEYLVNAYTIGLLGRPIKFESAAETHQSLICEDIDTLIQCLRFVSERTLAGCEPVKTGKGSWKPGGECWYMDIHKSIAEQERLAALEPGCFDVFDSIKDGTSCSLDRKDDGIVEESAENSD